MDADQIRIHDLRKCGAEFLVMRPFAFLSPTAAAGTSPYAALGGGTWAKGATTFRTGDGGMGGAIDTTGATLLVLALDDYPGVTGEAISDSKGNSWTPLTASTSGAIRVRLWYSFPTTTGSGHTFTVTGTDIFGSCAVQPFSGGGTHAFDQQNGTTSASGTSISPGSVTPGTDNQLVGVGVGCESSAALPFARLDTPSLASCCPCGWA